MPKRVSEALARPIRTGMQATPAWVITEGIDALVWDMTDRQFGAVMGILTLVIGWVQVTVENAKGKAILRAVPPKQAPVIDPAGPE